MVDRVIQNDADCGDHGQYGHRTTLAYDTNGYLNQITNPNDESVAMRYTERGLLTSFTTPKGATSRME
jgi:YD repeat-containing protein